MFSNVPCGIENRYFSRYCHKVRNVIIVTKQTRITLAMKVLKAIFDFCFVCFFLGGDKQIYPFTSQFVSFNV